jgi:hypothetical protein
MKIPGHFSVKLNTGGDLNAEELLQASVELFVWLGHVGADRLNAPAHELLTTRWLELIHQRRALLTNLRLSVPEIEAAAAHAPGIDGIA